VQVKQLVADVCIY